MTERDRLDSNDAGDLERFLYPALRIFLDSMQAALDLEDFIFENERRLQNVEEMFAAEASRMFPADPIESHRDAGRVIHRKIHEIMDAAEKLRDAGASDDDLEALHEVKFAELRVELLKVTGRPEDYGRYSASWNRIQSRPSGTRVFRASLLISAVSYFEVLISAIVRAQLALRPEILRTDEQKYSMRDIEAFSSIDEFRQYCAEKMAEGLLRGGLEDWMEWFAKRHKLDVPGVTDCPVDLVEVFQRRHLLVHNAGIVNALYLAKVSGSQDVAPLGTTLTVGRKYLLGAIDLLTSSGVKLAAALFVKLQNDPAKRKSVDHFVSHCTYELLQSGRYRVVEDVNVWRLTLPVTDSMRLTAMVNLWLARKYMYGLESIKDEVEAWDTETLASTYKLARLALLDRHEEAHALAERLLASEELSAEDWRGWPVLSGVRAFAASRELNPVDENPRLFDASHLHPPGDEPREH